MTLKGPVKDRLKQAGISNFVLGLFMPVVAQSSVPPCFTILPHFLLACTDFTSSCTPFLYLCPLSYSLHPEDRGSMVLQNIVILPHHYKVSWLLRSWDTSAMFSKWNSIWNLDGNECLLWNVFHLSIEPYCIFWLNGIIFPLCPVFSSF
jgi:hypothetical protein